MGSSTARRQLTVQDQFPVNRGDLSLWRDPYDFSAEVYNGWFDVV